LIVRENERESGERRAERRMGKSAAANHKAYHTHQQPGERERERAPSASERQHAHSENAAKYDSSIQFLSCIRLKKLKLDGPVFCLVKII